MYKLECFGCYLEEGALGVTISFIYIYHKLVYGCIGGQCLRPRGGGHCPQNGHKMAQKHVLGYVLSCLG